MTYITGAINFSGRVPHLDLDEAFENTALTPVKIFASSNAHICIQSTQYRVYENATQFLLCLGSKEVGLSNELLSHVSQNSLEHLRDEFDCTVIYIDKEQQICRIITDLLGTQPIYYSRQEHTLFFANRQRLLTKLLPGPWRLNQEVLFELLHIGLVNPPDTLIKNLYSVPVTHYFEYSQQIKLHPFRFAHPKYQEYELITMRNLLLEAIDKNLSATQHMHLMCSGGLDSSVLAALAASVLNKKVVLHTLSLDKNSKEQQQTQELQRHFHTENHYFTPNSPEVFAHIDASILVGESEVVGSLSMNAALEYLFAQTILQHSSTLFTGDDNSLTPASVTQQAPGYYHLKYGLVVPARINELLNSKQLNPLAYVHKTKPLLTHHKDYGLFAAHRLLVHATLIGKITAKYRLGHPQQYCIMPLNTPAYRRYINSLNYHQTASGYTYRDSLHALVQPQRLPSNYFKQNKSWLPAIWQQTESQSVLNDMYHMLLRSNLIKSELFNHAVLEKTLKNEQGEYCIPQLAAFFYLQRFCELFKLHY